MNNEGALREHLLYLLKGGGAHLGFDEAISRFPLSFVGQKVHGVPYTAWQLLEHLRIAQWDILEFSRDPKHVSPEWPEGYWPKEFAPRDPGMWNTSATSFQKDLSQFQNLVSDETKDLFAKIPHGTGQTLLREALLIADHNAYHIGQIVLLGRALGEGENKSVVGAT
ncbi:MAG TPA: DinB family protein [Bacteroidota bacterium]